MDKFTFSVFSDSYDPRSNKHVQSVENLPWQHLSRYLLAHNWSPAVYNNGARSLANYAGSPSLFAFDIDEGMTVEQAKGAFKDYQCMVHLSKSHGKVKNPGTPSEKPACDRFRVIFRLAEPITSDADFKTTWDSYADRYPLDTQTRSSSMFFFHGTSEVLNNPHGKPLEVVKSSVWEDIKADTYQFNKNASGGTHGVLSARSVEFMNSGAAPGLFNLRLFKCAVDHLEQRYTLDEFLAQCTESVRRGAFHTLDAKDMATVQSAFARKPKYGTRLSGKSSIELQRKEIADRIMDGEFVQCILPQHTIDYAIKDFENREVDRIDNPQIIERHISQEVDKPENQYLTYKRSEESGKPRESITKALTVEEVVKYWRRKGTGITQLPAPILWRGEEGWCHKRFNFTLTPGQPHPNWDQFLERLAYPEVFKAWVFSCFVTNHTTRQAMWLLGRNGQDGKSKVIQAIAELFGPAYAVITGSQVGGDSRFFLSQFIGKRLAVYPDCKMVRFPQTEAFRNLTGDDVVSMEFKGGGWVHEALRIKVLIGSNYEPDLTAANAEKSRLIVMPVAPSSRRDDPNWPARLTQELPQFLGDAQESFKALCPNNGDIQLPPEMGVKLDEMASASQESFGILFDTWVTVDRASKHELWATPSDIQNMLKRDKHNMGQINTLLRDFRVYLENKHGIFRTTYCGKNYYQHLVFKDPGSRATLANDNF